MIGQLDDWMIGRFAPRVGLEIDSRCSNVGIADPQRRLHNQMRRSHLFAGLDDPLPVARYQRAL